MKRRAKGIIMVVVAVVVGAVLVSPRIDWAPPSAESPLTRDDVLKALKQAVQDKEHFSKRGTASASHLGQLLGDGIWNHMYPVAYAEYYLIAQGSEILTTLADLSRDDEVASELRRAAKRVLEHFSDSQTVRTAHGISKEQYQAALFSKLDLMMTAQSYAGGAFGGGDLRILDWLNRVDDQDLDEWLETHAPKALEFRQEQRRRGYDPAVAFKRIAYRLSKKMRKNAMARVFRDQKEAAACAELLEAAYDTNSPLYPWPGNEWEDRLRKWYWANRKSLVYDFDRHCFVVARPPSPEDKQGD